jgi:formiminotetrahydrofolate cyclodeaminase
MHQEKLTELRVQEFLDRLASGAPTPGGGSVAALTGAMAAGLVSMVCHLTLGREKLAAFQDHAGALLGESEAARTRLQSAIAADAAAYDAVIAAFRLPRSTDEEKARRSDAIQAATREAARVPLQIAEESTAVLALAERAVGRTNPNAASDIAVAALLAGAAIESAAANVEVNLASLKDRAVAAEMGARLAAVRLNREGRINAVVEATRP